ncbi:MAG: prepilin-type N-terminal cleavage/methylation domain-containing protein [Gemmatimonadales bacterium]
MNRKGFTLIETLIAVVLLSLAAISLGQFMSKYQNATTKASLLSQMTSAAKERLEQVRADPRYTSLVSLYNKPSDTTTVVPGFPMIRRATWVTRDQTGSPARDMTTVTVRVFTTTAIMKDTVSLTAVIARP